MTSILSDLQKGYEQRAAEALQAPVSPPTEEIRPKRTRTYTGAALPRRQAWGQRWGGLNARYAAELRNEGSE